MSGLVVCKEIVLKQRLLLQISYWKCVLCVYLKPSHYLLGFFGIKRLFVLAKTD